ncbi:hypothetical protein Dtox_2905 [Desulfofarcimen acetoxidans DSM 771]|uniref:Uncharacterized protein n=1 Tax=Desulfofarcimen acetoxidans (strain ATCC 49208 / DSM 771 / KCTC 5769 / VKM B-1644 / 5575) TaxID=485916 RepID=C8W2I2_DESAS|nr:hypothetical protein [Desulfofarcimen acetoxidans]ACV63666.1 hypothetical protein Dtox_2905 [Desulfofarcimen acetoxidans DSM 771]
MDYKKILLSLIMVTIMLTMVLNSTHANTVKSEKTDFRPVDENFKTIKNSKTNFLEYKKLIDAKIEKLVVGLEDNEEVQVTITLAKALNEEEVVRIINDNNLKVHHFILRAIEKDTNQRVTISLSPNKDNLIDKETLNELMEGNNDILKGFIEICAYVPAINLEGLKSNNNIFLVDVSADQHLVNNPKNKFMKGLYWQLEEFEIAN